MREWLINIRRIKGFTQKTIADKCGISRSCYAGYESGVRTPNVDVAKVVGGELGFDWTLFFEKNGRKTRIIKKTA